MRELSIYRLIAAYGLLLILAMPVGIQGLHSWLDKHETRPHCDGAHGQIHLHDQSYAFDHCFLCAFHFSQYTETSSLSFTDVPGWVCEDLLISDKLLRIKDELFSGTTRGPPATA